MATLFEFLRTRLAPALLTAVGVTLVAAGLMNLGQPVEAGGPGSSAAPPASLVPTPTPTPGGSSSPGASTPSPGASTASPGGSASPAAPADRVATRVVIPALGIDLPVVKPPGGPDTYPLCNVAMYIQELSQPGLPGATYLYAHARTGMFLPLLEQSKVNNGAAMIGMLVEVYTSDDRLFLYEITEVRRHQLTLDAALAATESELWLQTSEGPNGTLEKLQVIARPLSSGPADPAQAHPVPKPVVCH